MRSVSLLALLAVVVSASGAIGDVAVDVVPTAAAKPAGEPTVAPSCEAQEEPLVVAVFVTPPEGSGISTAVFELSYDAEKLAIPGHRNDESVKERFDGFPQGAISAVNDMDGAMKVVVTGTKALPRRKPLFTIRFDVCAGAKQASAADLTCKVGSCVAMTTPVDGCTCRVEPAEAEKEEAAPPAPAENGSADAAE